MEKLSTHPQRDRASQKKITIVFEKLKHIFGKFNANAKKKHLYGFSNYSYSILILILIYMMMF